MTDGSDIFHFVEEHFYFQSLSIDHIFHLLVSTILKGSFEIIPQNIHHILKLLRFKVKQGPILPDSVAKEDPESLYGNIEMWKGADMPSWVKSAAKLLNGGSDGQDWTALAKKLGKINGFSCVLNANKAN